MNLKEFVESIIKQKEGFKLGDPFQVNEKALGGVVPILNLQAKKTKRGYAMLEEAQKEKKITINEKGTISEVEVISDSKEPIFVRMGAIFEGDTQERAATTSIIIMPIKEKQKVPVHCVHASRGISSGGMFYGDTSRLVPREVIHSFASGSSSQHSTWNQTSRATTRLCAQAMSADSSVNQNFASLGKDDLVGTMKVVEKAKKKISDAIKKIPRLENQVGAIIFDAKGILAVEVFDHPDSWMAFHDKVYSQYDDILTDEQEESLYSLNKEMIPRLVESFLIELSEGKLKTAFEKGNAITSAITGNVIGEFTKLGDKIIHLIGMRKMKDEEQPERERIRVSGPVYPTFRTEEPEVTYRTTGTQNIYAQQVGR